ncbi:MAG: response regulator transcription factor [Ferruginibacter sp.]|nr:response regulator transcription factor [Ferruginibacter sp.]
MFKILIADDHELIREGLSKIIAQKYMDAIITTANNGEDLIEKVGTEDWSLVISDISMLKNASFEALVYIKKVFPKLRVLVLSMHKEEVYGLRAYKSGAAGYITKEAPIEELLKAIDCVLNGNRYISPFMINMLSENMVSDYQKPLHEKLSAKEFEAFKLYSQSKTTTEVSQIMGLELSTVSTYKTRIFKKLKLTTNSDLTKYAIENKFY